MKQYKKRIFGILLSFALMLTIMPALSQTAFAGVAPPYEQYKNTTTVIKFDDKDWYLIDYDSSTVTLLSKECVGASQYNSSDSYVAYDSSTVKTAVDNWYSSNITADAKAAVSGGAMFLLNNAQARTIHGDNPNVLKCSKAEDAYANAWWLCSKGNHDNFAAFVFGEGEDAGLVYDNGDSVLYTLGVRPALKLDLSKVEFDSTTKTFSLKATEYPLWVGGTQVTSANASDIPAEGETKTGTASYNAKTNTLTLNNYSYSGVGYKPDFSASAGIYSEGIDLNIELIGTNTITTNGSAQAQSGIDIVNGNLTITARDNGSLTATGGNSNEMGSISNGICVRRTLDDSARDSKLTIADGATVNAAVNTTIEFASGTGVYANDGIDVSGTLTADGGNGGTSTGVSTGGNLDVSGTLTATAGSGASENYGINADKNVTVYEGGVVNASAIGNASADMNKGAGIYTWGWYDRSDDRFINGKVIIRGGVVNATSANGKGIECRGDVIIKDGEVTARGQECGIQCGEKNWETGKLENGTVSFEGGTITATGKGSEIEAGSVSTASSGVAGIVAPTIEIKSGINSLTATGKEMAIAGTVKNEIAGTGWTDKAGTAGKTAIAINTEGQDLEAYKKVQFPAKVDPEPKPEPKPAPTPAPKASAPKVTTTAKASAMTMTVKWTMKWGKVTGAKNYKVAYRKVGSKKWTYKNTKKTSYVVKGHKMKGLYEYKVGAVSKAGTTWSGTSRRYFSGVKANAKAAKGAIKASWKKVKGATGYQVLVATNKKMNNSKVYNVSSSAKSYKVNGLKKGKTYYVRVRPMKKADGVTYKGIQSKIHKVKVK